MKIEMTAGGIALGDALIQIPTAHEGYEPPKDTFYRVFRPIAEKYVVFQAIVDGHVVFTGRRNFPSRRKATNYIISLRGKGLRSDIVIENGKIV